VQELNDVRQAGRIPVLLAALGGGLLLAVYVSPVSPRADLPPFLAGGFTELHPFVQVVATAAALCLLRWWPYLLMAGGLLTIPGTLWEVQHVTVAAVMETRYPLVLVGMLACAQSLLSGGAAGLGAAVASLSIGSRLFGTALLGASWYVRPPWLPTAHLVLLIAALAGLIPAVWWLRRGDTAAAGPGDHGRWRWRRVRLILAGTLAMFLVVPLSLLTNKRLAAIAGVDEYALYRHPAARTAMTGVIVVVTVLILTAMAGRWSLAVALTAATVQVAVTAPMILAITTMVGADLVRALSALAGVALGFAVTLSRWRVPLAATLTVAGATALFIAYAATTGHPEKLAMQQQIIPVSLLLVVIAAAAAATVGATGVALAPHGALPAVLGPITAVLAAGGLQTVAVTYLRDGQTGSTYLNPVLHLTTSAVLLLVAGAAVSGLGLAQQLAARRAERRHAEQIRREAADAERDRLARPIHDGVLQVLALVQRHGSELGGSGAELAALAGEQEIALRNLLTGRTTAPRTADEDLGSVLSALASATIDVAAPAEPVTLPAPAVAEMTAAVHAALDNVKRHAGPGAHVWILLEDEGAGVRVTVRDNGAGFAPERLAEAAGSGRLGVAQSIRGRIADLNGTTTIFSQPGEGTEVEFWVPRE
jgi:signal transduction histidine kinase